MVIALAVTPATADEFQHLGALKTSVEYDTNPLMRVDGGTGYVWLGLIQPMYRAYWIPDTRSRLQLDVELRAERSSDQRIISNREDPTVELFWDYRGKRHDFDINISRSSAPVRLVEFEDSGVAGTNGTRIADKISGEWRHDWDNRTELFGAVAYGFTQYEKVPLIDFENVNLAFGGGQRQDDRLVYVVETQLSYLDPIYNRDSELPKEDVIPTTLFSAIGGADWEYNELWHVEGRAGLITSHRTSIDVTPNASIKGVYELPLFTFEGSLSRETIPSGFGEFLTGDVLQAKVIYDTDPKNRFEATASVRQNRKPTTNSSMRFGLFHRYKMTPVWTLRSSWEYKQTDGFRTATGMVTRVTLEFSPG